MDDHLQDAPQPGAAEDICVHRWRITGSTDVAEGTCRLCGMTRQFTNERRWMGGQRGRGPRAVPTPQKRDGGP